MDYNTFTAKDYFKNLDLPASVQENLMGRLNLQLGVLSEKVKASLTITDEALATCKEKGGKAEESAKEWKRCSFTCNSLITEAVNQEVGSTAFMLKLLADSVIRTDDKKHRLKIGLDPSFYKRDVPPGASCHLLTGRWKEDAPFLRLVLPPSTQGRLVMGFGPSASGKTHWAKKLLRLLAQADHSFPKVFFSVDGGIVRESSAVYQFANEMAHCAGFAGFTNLHAGMFETGKIKKAMEQYLLAESNRVSISLYVPETLGKCEMIAGGVSLPGFSCKDYLKPFHEITRDKMWIGFLMWQHETASDHMKDTTFLEKYSNMKYKCAGCTESGKKREKEDGKPYDSGVYAQSMRNGRKYMAMAPGGKYEIHNAGCDQCISVMWDRSVRNAFSDKFSDIVKTMNKGNDRIEYVDERSGLTGVPKPREKNGYTPEGETMMADEATRKATVAQAKRNANAAATSAATSAAAQAAAAQKAAANRFPTLPPGYTNARKQALVNAEKERRKTLKTAERKAKAASDAAEVSLSKAKERLRFARLDKEKNATKTNAYDKAVRYVTAAEKAAKEARANAEDAERAASMNVEINLGLPENAERDARMAQRLASEKAARAAAAANAKEDFADPAKAAEVVAHAVAHAETAMEQEREKSRAAHDRRAKKPNEITERAFQDAVAAVEAAVSYHTAAMAALRAAKEVERVRGITRVAWRESTKNPMTEEEKVAAQTIRDTAVMNATTAARAARAAAATAKATAATTSAQASASAAEAEEELDGSPTKVKAAANRAKTLKKASAQIQSASHQAAANDRNRQERAARAALNSAALSSGVPKPSVSRFANIGVNGNSIIPHDDPNAFRFP